MSGLIKSKKYDWKDSNMELVGSDEDRGVKKEAAQKEPMWQGCGEKSGLKVWRIEKFQVKEWPIEDYGRFYEGDSYIILKSYLKEDKLLHDIHFWIGKHSSQDEYGTAAYKTVELDTFLDDVPVQHRECQGHESEMFLGYFKRIEILKGGVATGFRHVTPQEYKPRLLLFSGTGKNIKVKEISVNKDLDSVDVFLLDIGVQIVQWNGKNSSMFERNRASMYCQQVKNERTGKTTSEVIDEGEDDGNNFNRYLTEARNKVSDEDDDYEDDNVDGHFGDSDETENMKKLFRISDSSGELSMDLVAESDGDLNRADLSSTDVYLVDTGKECFVWIGRRASKDEKSNGLIYAHNYLKRSTHPLVPVTCLKEGSDNKRFDYAFGG